MRATRQSSLGLGKDFLFSRLHGIWSNAVKGKLLDQLIRDGREEALLPILARMGVDGTRREEVQRNLACRYIEQLASLSRLADSRISRFYNTFIRRYHFGNLKTILHYRYFPEREVPIEFLLIESDHLPDINTGALLEARNVNQFYQHLPPTELQQLMLPMLVELDDTRDLVVSDCRLDQFYYSELLEHTTQLPVGLKKIAMRLVTTEIDLTNLIMILRNGALYHLPLETLEELCIPGGYQLKDHTLTRSLEQSEKTDLPEMLPLEYRKIISPLRDEELYVVENALWNHLYGVANHAFKDYNRTGSSVIAFPFLKRFELLNINRIFEGIHFELHPDDIRTVMIGAERV